MPASQLVFLAATLATFGFFGYTAYNIRLSFMLARPAGKFPNIGRRIITTLLVAFGQTKMFKRPVPGLLHALVYWGFLVITAGTAEMMLDGLTGGHRSLSVLGSLYSIVMWSGEVFAVLVIISCLLFLSRRYFVRPKRFIAPEMKPSARRDATFILSMILLLMFSLLGMNVSDVQLNKVPDPAAFPVSALLAGTPVMQILPGNMEALGATCWWMHILMVYFFLNYLPYSKHFHVIMAVPNVFLSRLEPPAKLGNMASVTREVQLMLNPGAAPPQQVETPAGRFGVRDLEDATWKNILDAYTCTECGRCTARCPANLTGKKLSPRKLYIDLRARVKDLMKGEGAGKTLVGDYITQEELWACTTCMACIEECPVEIDHVPFIVDMRRYLVMEEAKAPQQLNNMFTNIENNGAPWRFSPEERAAWSDGMNIPTLAGMQSKGETAEVLFWIGCAGCYDERYKSVTRAFARIMQEAGIRFAILGKEESCTGDPAKRAGNEFLFQMQAMKNIQTLDLYGVKKVVTACPHCFNTIKNEYPGLGGNYEVVHHSDFLKQLLAEGRVRIQEGNPLKGKTVTYHDSCYIGRGNGIYESPREIIESLQAEVREMKSCRQRGLCCGAGGAQMFKDEEKGNKGVNIARTEEALETGAEIVASACPFCMTMLSDGMKQKNKEDDVKVMDLAELVAEANGWKEK